MRSLWHHFPRRTWKWLQPCARRQAQPAASQPTQTRSRRITRGRELPENKATRGADDIPWRSVCVGTKLPANALLLASDLPVRTKRVLSEISPGQDFASVGSSKEKTEFSNEGRIGMTFNLATRYRSWSRNGTHNACAHPRPAQIPASTWLSTRARPVGCSALLSSLGQHDVAEYA